MFRAPLCPSSGVQGCTLLHMVFSTYSAGRSHATPGGRSCALCRGRSCALCTGCFSRKTACTQCFPRLQPAH